VGGAGETTIKRLPLRTLSFRLGEDTRSSLRRVIIGERQLKGSEKETAKAAGKKTFSAVAAHKKKPIEKKPLPFFTKVSSSVAVSFPSVLFPKELQTVCLGRVAGRNPPSRVTFSSQSVCLSDRQLSAFNGFFSMTRRDESAIFDPVSPPR